MSYQDLLKDTSKPDPSNSNYFIVTITDLNISQAIPIQFRWKYNDGTFSAWSAARVISTPAESFPNVPSTLTIANNTPGYLEIAWNGNDSTGSPLTNFDRVDVYINGAPFDSTKAAISFFGAGTKTVVAPAGTYIISSIAVSKIGTLSAISAPVTRTVLANVPLAGPSVPPSTPTVSSVLGAIQISWNGKTSTNADQPYGFNSAKVYVGTSAGFTPSASNQVDVLNFANGQNTLNIGVGTVVDGTALSYGIDYYVKIATTNGTDTSTAVSATGNPKQIGKVTSGDIVTVTADKVVTGTLDTSSIITVGSTSGKHVKISGTGDPLLIYGSGGINAGPILSFNGTKLSIVGDGAFTGNISGATGTLTNALTVGTPTSGLYPFSVDSSGVLRAIAGTIGGWTLSDQALYKTSNFQINGNDGIIYAGPSGGAHLRISQAGVASYSGGTPSGTLNIASNGNITATNVNLSGVITATSGTIGNWTIGATTLTGGSTTLNSNGSITVAGSGATTTINNTGLLTINGLTSAIAGISLNNGTTELLTTYLKLNQASIFESNGTNSTPQGSLTFSTSNSPREIHFFDQGDLSGAVSINKSLRYPGVSSATGSTLVVVGTGSRVGFLSSSRLYKKNIQPLNSGDYLNKILQLQPVSFDWKNQPLDISYRINYGLIAEDVAEIPILESLVNYNESNEPISISYERLTPFLVLAIKELSARLDALEG